MSRMKLVSQTSPATETLGSNGNHKQVHVVVKNHPFDITLSTHGNITFNQVSLHAELDYDTEERRRVDFVKTSPFDYKTRISDCGTELTATFRMKVLSSQLEDMNFLLKLSGSDLTTGKAIANMVVYSQPIKVVSKPDQIQKILQPGLVEPRRKRKATGDNVSEALERIERNHQEQKQLLELLLKQQQDNSQLHQLWSPPPEVPQQQSSSSSSDAASRFDQAFYTLLQSYQQMAEEDRSVKIRKLVSNVTTTSSEAAAQMLDMFTFELRREAPHALFYSMAEPISSEAAFCSVEQIFAEHYYAESSAL